MHRQALSLSQSSPLSGMHLVTGVYGVRDGQNVYYRGGMSSQEDRHGTRCMLDEDKGLDKETTAIRLLSGRGCMHDRVA